MGDTFTVTEVIETLAIAEDGDTLVLRDEVLELIDVGEQGPPGSQNVFVGPTAPAVPAGQTYAWFQTGLGTAGDEITLWIEDGHAPG
jgi:hypothetical protein